VNKWTTTIYNPITDYNITAIVVVSITVVENVPLTDVTVLNALAVTAKTNI